MPKTIEGPARLRCPVCFAHLDEGSGPEIICAGCPSVFPVRSGIPVFMPATQDDARVKEFFDRVATHAGDGKLSYVPFAAPGLDRQLTLLSHAFLQALERWIPGGSRILDVGVGHGALLEPVVSKYVMTGVDVAFEMLPLARERGYRVYQADAVALPFEDGEFDAVICAEVLQHFPDPRPILAELARTCRPGGSILISTLNKVSLARWLRRNIAKLTRPPALPLPILRRSAGEIAEAGASGLGLHVDEVAWLLSPLDRVVFTRKATAAVAPLATNFIVKLRKEPLTETASSAG